MGSEHTPLGFSWDKALVSQLRKDASVDVAKFRFQHALPHAVWEAAAFENSPYTFEEVQTLLDGVTVGGHTLADQQMILGLAQAAKTVIDLVTKDEFQLDKRISDLLHAQIAVGQAIEVGHFRGEGAVQGGGTVRLGEGGFYQAPSSGENGKDLREAFAEGVHYLSTEITDAGVRALLYAAWATRMQFYFDGNKRTARWMMNGLLMSNSYEPIGVPVQRKQQWHKGLNTLFTDANATPLLQLLSECQFSKLEEESRAK